MSVAARSVTPETSAPQRSQKIKRSRQKNTKAKVIKRESSFKNPLWLRSLLMLQQSTGAIAFGTIIAVFSVYAAIVYTQQLWGKEYQKLKTLQSQERILTETNESIRNNLADLAQRSGMGLVPLDPHKSVFLDRTATKLEPKVTPKPKKKQRSDRFVPSGY